MSDLSIAEALWNACHQHGHQGLELEFRLGHVLAGGQFSPNVGRDQFTKLKACLDDSQNFEKYEVETVEKIGNGIKHVTTLHFKESSDTNPPPPSYCMSKIKVAQVDFPADGSPYTIRCSISAEDIIPVQHVHTQYTRHKKRSRYVYKKVWAFDLTEVVSNTDVDSEESFEVEIELLDSGILFECTMDHIARWGLTLVGDAIRMLRVKD